VHRDLRLELHLVSGKMPGCLETLTGSTERISCSSPDWLLSQRYWNQRIVLGCF
jgi:hypothetical protein